MSKHVPDGSGRSVLASRFSTHHNRWNAHAASLRFRAGEQFVKDNSQREHVARSAGAAGRYTEAEKKLRESLQLQKKLAGDGERAAAMATMRIRARREQRRREIS